MTQLPITHFNPKEIGTSVEELINLGYQKDIYGMALNDAEILYCIFKLEGNDFLEQCMGSKTEDALEIINLISGMKIRDKSGTFIGARMGRPEKAKVRKLDGDPHTIFPVGKQGGKLRSFQSAIDIGSIEAEFPAYFCGVCKKNTILSVCEQCDTKTQKAGDYKAQKIDIGHYFKNILKKLNMHQYPDLIKGVRGTSSKNHIP